MMTAFPLPAIPPAGRPALLFSAAASAASAQVIPGLVGKSDLSIFGTLPVNVTPDFGYYAPVLFGYQFGGFFKHAT